MNNYTYVTSVDCIWLGKHVLFLGSLISWVRQTQNLMFILILAHKNSTLHDEGTSRPRFPQHEVQKCWVATEM